MGKQLDLTGIIHLSKLSQKHYSGWQKDFKVLINQDELANHAIMQRNFRRHGRVWIYEWWPLQAFTTLFCCTQYLDNDIDDQFLRKTKKYKEHLLVNYQYRILGIHNSQAFGIVGIDDSQTFGFVGIDNSQTITLCTSLLSEEIDHRCRFFCPEKFLLWQSS